MSGALGDAGADGDWVLVAVPPAAASGVQPAANSQLPDDATAATAATVPSHEEAVARGQSMAATASADAAEIRPFDRLPDDGLAKVLAVLKQSEHRRVESVCQRWRQIRPRASLARVKSLRFRARVVTYLARRFRNNQEDYYLAPLCFSNLGIGRTDHLFLHGTGDDFVISVPFDYNTHPPHSFFLRMNPHTGVADHRGLTEDRAQATHFEAVETLFRGQREYYTLPDFFYFRLKATPPSFLKVHAWEQIGVVPQGCVMQHRRARSNEGHAFRIYR